MNDIDHETFDEPDEVPPIDELAGLELEGDPEFVERVSRAIERREATTSMVDLSSSGLLALLMEYVAYVVDLFSPTHRHGSRSD